MIVNFLQPFVPTRFKITRPVVYFMFMLLNPGLDRLQLSTPDFPSNCYHHFLLILAVADVLKELLDNPHVIGGCFYTSPPP